MKISVKIVVFWETFLTSQINTSKDRPSNGSIEEIGRTFAENLPAMLYFTNYFIDNEFPKKENQ